MQNKLVKMMRSCGVWSTARYMQKQGFPIEVALLVLKMKG
jgi:hypothetical protein